MSAPDPTNASDLGTFLLILDQFPEGARLTVEHIRPELEAAQIPPSSYGPLFKAACVRGELRRTNLAVVCKKPSRRGGSAFIYVRTIPTESKAG